MNSSLMSSARCCAWVLMSVSLQANAGPPTYAVEEEHHLAGIGRVTIVHGDARIVAPDTEPEQEGSEQAKVSPDGRTVGWLALTSNCCTSYPLPTALVLYRDGRVIRRVNPGAAIWAWGFGPGAGEVVFQEAPAHGPEYLTFTWLRIRDGKRLGEFECNQDEQVHGPRPGWTRVVDVKCPDYVPQADTAPPTNSAMANRARRADSGE